MSTSAKILTWSSVTVVLALAAFIFFKFCFVYSEGVNEGDINYFQKEGFIFKTYEGKMIQSGLRSSKGIQGSIQSNEFKFSVVDEKVAEQLNEVSNTGIKLHWKRYLGTLPWRGKSEYIVDEIVSSNGKKVVPVAEPAVQTEQILEDL